MALSVRQFNIELYREHLEDAGFLYDQRRAYLHDLEVDWPDLRNWEDRFEAHIDALMVGGDLALETCQHATAGEAGELHAALRVLCRQDRKDAVFGVLDALDPAEQPKVDAAAEALCREAPSTWRDDLLRALANDARLTSLLAHVAGYRRFASEKLLRSRLAADPPVGLAQLAWALGRVGTAESVSALWPLLGSDDDDIVQAAAIALMRLGEDGPVHQAMQTVSTRTWGARVLGIGGSPRAVPLLLELLKGQDANANVVIALGLLGDLAAVVPLLELLDDDSLKVPAAVALNTLTGAALHQIIFISDQIDPDELSDEEREAFERDGTPPTHLGKPLGTWERRPLLNKAEWHAWLDENKHRFNRQQRWRMGLPHSPTGLVACLKEPTSPYAVRAASYEELVARFGLDVPFEVDLPVSLQWRFLPKIEGWASQTASAFEPGRAYFAKRPQG